MVNIETNINDDLYYKLLDFSLQYCNMFLFVIHDHYKIDRYKSLLLELNYYKINEEENNQWPGTVLSNKTVKIIRFSYNLNSVNILKKYSKSLFEWNYPDLPDDLCLLKNSDPVLINIAHENDAYVQTEKEIEKEFCKFFRENEILFNVSEV